MPGVRRPRPSGPAPDWALGTVAASAERRRLSLKSPHGPENGARRPWAPRQRAAASTAVDFLSEHLRIAQENGIAARTVGGQLDGYGTAPGVAEFQERIKAS